MTKINKKKIEEFIRVDHAGERGAVKIYEGQLLALNTFVKDESLKKMQQIKMKIEDFLKLYNKDKNYAYILSSSSNIIYYKDSTYNITTELISGLNEAYKKNK